MERRFNLPILVIIVLDKKINEGGKKSNKIYAHFQLNANLWRDFTFHVELKLFSLYLQT